MELKQTHIRAISLFYFFSLLDESLAIEASEKTVLKCKQKLKKSEAKEGDLTELVVSETAKGWENYGRKVVRGASNLTFGKDWVLSPYLDLAPWKQFQKEATNEELLAVIWSQILCFSEFEIARGLQTTRGTVRYRVGKGLRKLGRLNRPGQHG